MARTSSSFSACVMPSMRQASAWLGSARMAASKACAAFVRWPDAKSSMPASKGWSIASNSFISPSSYSLSASRLSSCACMRSQAALRPALEPWPSTSPSWKASCAASSHAAPMLVALLSFQASCRAAAAESAGSASPAHAASSEGAAAPASQACSSGGPAAAASTQAASSAPLASSAAQAASMGGATRPWAAWPHAAAMDSGGGAAACPPP
mmetsp:Transcript_8981/g.26084  ORF Transcript_8981/g.26084 Transcript_8981/m.26084 type:complete len:211 (-) Transcript_8981:711-1343(-)